MKIEITKLDEKSIHIWTDSGLDSDFPAVLKASYNGKNGIIKITDTEGLLQPGYASSSLVFAASDLKINGVQQNNGREATKELNAFIGNFKMGGGASANNPNKGYFLLEADLLNAYPLPLPGCYAWVGNRYPGTVYKEKNGSWIDTQEVPNTDMDINNWNKNNW